jgi:hypothetical protein
MPSWAIYGNERRGGIHLPPAAVNLLLSPSAFDAADWTKNAVTVTANSQTDPDGGSTAEDIIEDNTTDFHGLLQSVTKDASVVTYDFSVSVKDTGRFRITLQLDDTAGNGRKATYDVQNGIAVGVAPSGFGTDWSGGTQAITDEGNGWWRCELNGVVSNSATTVRAVLLTDAGGTTDAQQVTYAGNELSAFYLHDAVLVVA